MFIRNCSPLWLKNCRGNLSFDKKSWSFETCLYLCMTIYHSLRARNKLHFLINIDLKPHAKSHENPILTLASSVFPSSCDDFQTFTFTSF